MKNVIVAWVIATITAVCALSVNALVLLNIDSLNYAGAMFGLAVVVIAWFPFVVSCYQVKDEWGHYLRRELQKQKRRTRYSK